jgi:GWxTD domain-containing protein
MMPRSSGLRAFALVVAMGAVAQSRPLEATAQALPGTTYADLLTAGHKKLADKLSKTLEVRSNPDSADVQSLLDRWEREAGGPRSGYDYLAVSRLWLKADQAAEAELALRQADREGAPPGLLLLDQARVAFMFRDPKTGAAAYWKGCEYADQATTVEYWLDIEALATPVENEYWDRFLSLPPHERDLCNALNRFWNERAAASLVERDTRVAQHYARLEVARRRYLRRSGKKGPSFSTRMGRPTKTIFDDRGLVYLRMGEPDRRTSFGGAVNLENHMVSAECYQPNESWAYYYPEGTRMYHFSTFGGTDDWWLAQNLGDVYACGNPEASSPAGGVGVLSPVNANRSFVSGRYAYLVLKDLYKSRGGLDVRYEQMAALMRYEAAPGATGLATGGLSALTVERELSEESAWVVKDARFMVDSVPERPKVDPKSRMLVEELQFRSRRPGVTTVWLDAIVSADGLIPDTLPDGSYRYRLETVIGLIDQRSAYSRGNKTVEVVTPEMLPASAGIPVRIPIDLPPSEYRYTLLVKNARRAPGADARVGNYYRAALSVSLFDGNVPQLSDLAIAPDSAGDWSVGGGVFLRPSPLHNTGPDGIAHVYYEVYGLEPGGDYLTTVQLEPDDGEPFTLEYTGDSPANPSGRITGYIRLDLSESPTGDYTMRVRVEDRKTGVATLPYNTRIVVDRL